MTNQLAWFKSSYSDPDGSNCVEIAPLPHTVHVRDSKTPDTPHLLLAPSAWAEFVSATAH